MIDRYRPTRLLVQKSWTRLWWIVWDPDEPIAALDTPTYVRAFDRTRAIEKALQRWFDAPENVPEEIDIAQYLSESMRTDWSP